MSCLIMPKCVIKEINTLQIYFWQGKKVPSKKILYLRSGVENFPPTRYGGLGINDMDHANQVSISLLSWKVLSNKYDLTTLILKGK